MISRCINIDWLEVHCCEPTDATLDADFYRADGWSVYERPYGTRVYEQMFTLLEFGTDLPLIEIRRVPVGNKSVSGLHVLDPHSCHIRLVNRTCYFPNAAHLLFTFLTRYNIQFIRISRIDLCLDFEYFDSKDDPQKFLDRYLRRKYSKINQGNIRVHGKDMWDGRFWNSVAWGAPKSMVGTKLYDKTMELRERKDKPYIRQAWAAAGLVDDFVHLTKTRADGTTYNPRIWRLEFSVKSSARRWFVVEDFMSEKKRVRSIRNTLDCYFSRQQLLDVFASLADHYFHFKKFVPDTRKDRCPDKVLFHFNEQAEFYQVERVASSEPVPTKLDSLRRRLEQYRLEHPLPDILNACDTLINDIDKLSVRKAAACPWDAEEITLLRQLIARRINHATSEPLSTTLGKVRALLDVETELFGEQP